MSHAQAENGSIVLHLPFEGGTFDVVIADMGSRAARDAGFRMVEHGPLMHGFLTGVSARRPVEAE